MYKAAQTQYKHVSTLEDLPAILTTLESARESLRNIACNSIDSSQDLSEGYVDLQQRVAIAIESVPVNKMLGTWLNSFGYVSNESGGRSPAPCGRVFDA